MNARIGNAVQRYSRSYAALKDKVIDTFGAANEEDQMLVRPMLREVWCPVIRQYFGPVVDTDYRSLECRDFNIRLCHIIPRSMGNARAAVLLGQFELDRVLTHMDNLMILHKDVAEAFEQLQITFVPRQSANMDVCEYRIAIADPELSAVSFPPGVYNPRGWFLNRAPTWGDLQGKIVEFKNEHRPGEKNLMIHAILCFLRYRGFSQEYAVELRERLFWGEKVWPRSYQTCENHVLQFLTSGHRLAVPFDFAGPTDAGMKEKARSARYAAEIRWWIHKLSIPADNDLDDEEDIDEDEAADNIATFGQAFVPRDLDLTAQYEIVDLEEDDRVENQTNIKRIYERYLRLTQRVWWLSF